MPSIDKPSNIYLSKTGQIHDIISEIESKLGFIKNLEEPQPKPIEPPSITELQISLQSILERLEKLNDDLVV